jgi:hypothetical protein
MELSELLFEQVIPDFLFYNHNTYDLRPTLYKDVFIGKLRTLPEEFEIERAFLRVNDISGVYKGEYRECVYQMISSFNGIA